MSEDQQGDPSGAEPASEEAQPASLDPTTRLVSFTRGPGGFGFKIKGLVHGDTSMEVVMQVINGRFYAPLQYVSGVDKGGVADLAGLKLHDRILEVNEQDVQGATHTRVVNIIKYGGDAVSLKVFSISAEEAGRLKRIEDILLEDKRRSMRGDEVQGTMGNTPVLSNEAQLQIFEMVKKGMNIDDALLQASRASSSEQHPKEGDGSKEKRSSMFGGSKTKDKDKPKSSEALPKPRPASVAGPPSGAPPSAGAASASTSPSKRATDLPVLSNEMQIAVFEMVKRGLSIDAALAKAKMLETSFDSNPETRELGAIRPEDHPAVLKLVKDGLTIDQAMEKVHGKKRP